MRSLFCEVVFLEVVFQIFEFCYDAFWFLRSCFKCGKYSRRRYRRYGKFNRKLDKLLGGWILDALVILGGSAVLAVMCVSFFG